MEEIAKNVVEIKKSIVSLEKRQGGVERRLTGIEAMLNQVIKGVKTVGTNVNSVSTAVTSASSKYGLPAGAAAAQMAPPSAKDLMVHSRKLKKQETRSLSAAHDDKAIDAIAAIYREAAGDFEKIAKKVGAQLDLLQKMNPQTATEFAEQLLEGRYSRPGEELQVTVRIGPPSALALQNAKLKHVDKLRTASKLPVDNDVSCMARVYDQMGGDLDKIAAATGADKNLLNRNPPKDAQDFGMNLLLGKYMNNLEDILRETHTAFNSDDAKVTDDALQARGGKLKKVSSKVGNSFHVDEGAVEFFAKLYADNEGDIEKIAQIVGANVSLIEKAKPTDASDFAKKLLGGLYTDETSEELRAKLGDKFKDQLGIQATRLRRVNTKDVGIGSAPAPEDLEVIAKIYVDSKGDLAKIAETCGASLSLLKAKPPKDAQDFAKKLLDGAYVGERSEIARKEFRSRLVADLEDKGTKLRKIATKENMDGPSEADMQVVAKLYTENGGDLEKLAKLTGSNLALLQKKPPLDADDFAKRLLTGSYIGEESEVAKMKFRSDLKDQLEVNRSNLKKVSSKITDASLKEADVKAIAKLYEDNSGDLEALAVLTGSNLSLLKSKAPKDATDFATNLLEGKYVGDTVSIARFDLKQALKKDLDEQKEKLKKAPDAEEDKFEPTDQEMGALRQMYRDCKGDLKKLAHRSGAQKALLEKKPPKDAEEFAKNLLAGLYVGEAVDVARYMLRNKLQDQLASQAKHLKKTEMAESGNLPTPKEVELAVMVNIYTANTGDLDKLATLCGIEAVALKKNPPTDAKDFAVKLLSGYYSA